jgi:hypothetical protein
VLQQVASGLPAGDVSSLVGISERTFYRLEEILSGGMLQSEARELKQLRDENAKCHGLPVARFAPGC